MPRHNENKAFYACKSTWAKRINCFSSNYAEAILSKQEYWVWWEHWRGDAWHQFKLNLWHFNGKRRSCRSFKWNAFRTYGVKRRSRWIYTYRCSGAKSKFTIGIAFSSSRRRIDSRKWVSKWIPKREWRLHRRTKHVSKHKSMINCELKGVYRSENKSAYKSEFDCKQWDRHG